MVDSKTIAGRQRLGNRIKQLREENGWSQQELAYRCGLKQQNVARVELGKYNTGQDILFAIGQVFGKTLDFV